MKGDGGNHRGTNPASLKNEIQTDSLNVMPKGLFLRPCRMC